MTTKPAPAPGAHARGSRQVLEPVGRALGRPFVAELTLVAFTAFVYRDALWGVPRWDHLIFLYEASRFGTVWDLLSSAPAWNRSVSVGDHVEYRPLFHLLLGVEQVLFGRAYALWQGVGIALHALQAVLLLRLGRRAFPRSAWPSFLLATLFTSLLIPSETVAWFHANAYIMCAACLTAALERLLAYLETGEPGAARVSLLLALIASFTYELGPFYCVVVGTLLAVSAVPLKPAGSPAIRSPRSARLRIAALHGAVAAVYGAASITDLLLRFPKLAGSDTRLPALGDLPLGISYAVQQVGFWLGGLIFPSLYDIGAGSRASFRGLIDHVGPAVVLNVTGAALALLGAAWLLLTLRSLQASAPGALSGCAFLAGYSLFVALGRSVPRGLRYTLVQNLQHAYPALLIVLVTVILGAWSWRRPAEVPTDRHRGHRTAAVVLAFGDAGLTVSNAAATMALLAEFRHSYAAPKSELLYYVEQWHARPGRSGLFQVAGDCPGNDPLPWFGMYLRHDTELAYFIDVIFPDTSYNLHHAPSTPGSQVDVISCAEGTAPREAVMGDWWESDRRVTVRAGPDGHLEVAPARGDPTPLLLGGRVVSVPAWGARGLLSHDGRYVFWPGATPWHR